MATAFRNSDILTADMALSIMPNLSTNECRVALVIIEHFDPGTGHCSPSIERLAMITGLCRGAVSRATNKLDRLGLIRKVSRGGPGHPTAYLPSWEKFRGFVAGWEDG